MSTPSRLPVARGADAAADRTRFHQRDRLAAAAFGGDDAAVRAHQQQRAVEAAAAQAGIELGDIFADLRPDIGVGRRGRGALELVPLARQLGAGGDEHAGQQPAHLRRRGLLVLGREVRVEKADRQRLDLLARAGYRRAARARRSASGVRTWPDPSTRSVDLEAQLARDQRRLAMEAQVERLGAVAAADFQQVAEALGRQQRGLGAGALQQRVDDKRGAVLDEARIARVDRGLADAVEDGVAQLIIGRRDFWCRRLRRSRHRRRRDR